MLSVADGEEQAKPQRPGEHLFTSMLVHEVRIISFVLEHRGLDEAFQLARCRRHLTKASAEFIRLHLLSLNWKKDHVNRTLTVYTEPLVDITEIIVPQNNNGLYAIDILDPSFVVMCQCALYLLNANHIICTRPIAYVTSLNNGYVTNG
ncbi:DegPprotease 7 [Striga asiatica]|uniref:DegPprotease 7 n=1 Tax=Striga asiatica TaxID=4170 RepID=A0A5A7R8R7_STRAF|nr:DegPprotease 7 [Striga asiatica]